MHTLQDLQDKIPQIEAALGYSFRNKDLLIMAFVHRSFVNENRATLYHNERLEFLGDSVLGMLIAQLLYERYPEKPEGELSSLRSRLVEGSSCTAYVHKIGVDPFLLLGKGERGNDGRGRQTILSDLFEAIVGAIYLDGGLEATRNFIVDTFQEAIEERVSAPQSNWKAILQDICQRQLHTTPVYTLLQTTGPEHDKIFEVAVEVQGKILGKGSGASKKEAQQNAAMDTIKHHFNIPEEPIP